MKDHFKDCLEYTYFSWQQQGKIKSPQVVGAEGVYLHTKNGGRILDFGSQLINVNAGHNHPHIKERIKKQLDDVIYTSPKCSTSIRGELGRHLASIAPGDLNKTFFTNGGAEANENAIKIARLVTGRHKILSLYRSYHGATYGAISVGGDPRKLPVDSQAMPGTVRVENPYCYQCPWGKTYGKCQYECVSQLERTLHYEGPESVAAVILEGQSGTSGCIKYPPGYLKQVREITKKYGILLIVDEIMSGFCRTGEWFGVDHESVVPDMITVAKGMTSGYLPMGGVITNKAIAKHFNDRVLPLGLTYSAHPMSCAAAVGAIEVYKEGDFNQKAKTMGAYVEKQVEKLKKKHACIGDFRNTGLLGCIELVKDRKTREPYVPFNTKPKDLGKLAKVHSTIIEAGLFTFLRWNYIFIAPPLTISKAEVDEGLAMISKGLSLLD